MSAKPVIASGAKQTKGKGFGLAAPGLLRSARDDGFQGRRVAGIDLHPIAPRVSAVEDKAVSHYLDAWFNGPG